MSWNCSLFTTRRYSNILMNEDYKLIPRPPPKSQLFLGADGRQEEPDTIEISGQHLRQHLLVVHRVLLFGGHAAADHERFDQFENDEEILTKCFSLLQVCQVKGKLFVAYVPVASHQEQAL